MDQPKILVAIRKRPLSKKEQSKGQTDIVSVKNQQTVIVSEYKQKVDLTKYLEQTVFNFDFAFDQNTNNQQIYLNAVRPLVDSAFQGAKVTCFAYGQTGSGKTFTMNGNQKMGVSGLYTLGATDIFAYLSDSRFRHLTARLSFFEIYCGKLFDLLNKRTQLTLREDNKSNINIIGLQQTPVDSLQKFQQLLTYGSVQRVTSQNSANNQSSRSHAILQVTLKQGKKIFGKISFIDLAGNQRGADHTDMKKQTRIDGAEINKSLLSLKQCIRALDQGKGHTPFRGSKLTMVLKDSFVGFCRTIMIGNVSPSSASSQNTLNTLRYADRVKQLRKPTQSLSKQQLKARQMMLPRQNNNAIKIDINKDDDAEDIEAKRKQAQKNYGIKQQSPKNTKDMQRQMSSDPYRKSAQTQRTRQQSFGGPSISLNRPLVGGLKQPQQLNVPQQNSSALNRQPKSPVVANNGKINLQNNNQNKQPVGSQRNIYQNNSYNYQQQQQNQQSQQNQNDHQQQPGLHRANSYQVHPKPGFDHKMDVQGIGMTNSQVGVGKQNNNFFNNNQQQQQPSLNYSNNNSNVHNAQYYSTNNQGGYRQENVNNNYHPQNQYQQQPNQYQFQNQLQNGNTNNNNSNYSQRSVYNSQIQDRMNQYRSNYQQPQQRPQSANQFPVQGLQFNRVNQFKPPPQKVIIPQDFQGMIQFVSTANDPDLRQRVHQKLHEVLFNQENDLINSHSDTLRSSLDHLKSQMSLIADLQSNRDAVSTREYIALMQESIDEKISLLQMLRQKMIQFSYKLQRVQEIDEQNQNVGPRNQDQQLLDDLH